MTISKALKEKNRLVKKIQTDTQNMLSNNSHIVGTKVNYDSKVLLNSIIKDTAELVSLKTKIHRASDPVRDVIFNLSEFKLLLSRLQVLNTQSGLVVSTGYNSGKVEVEYETTISFEDKSSLIKDLELYIEENQDQLDIFNAKTEI